MLALMLSIVQFAYWTVKRDKTPMSHMKRYLSVYLILVSTVLILVQPVAMLAIGSWHTENFFFDGGDFKTVCHLNTDCGSGMCMSNAYSCTGKPYSGDSAVLINGACVQLDATGVNCSDTQAGVDCACGMDTNALFPNTTEGWLIQVFCTWLGFIFMFIGVFKATKLHKKIAMKWNRLRGRGGTRTDARKKPDSGSFYPRATTASAPPVDGCTTGD